VHNIAFGLSLFPIRAPIEDYFCDHHPGHQCKKLGSPVSCYPLLIMKSLLVIFHVISSSFH
jgi:hypothetical protein